MKHKKPLSLNVNSTNQQNQLKILDRHLCIASPTMQDYQEHVFQFFVRMLLIFKRSLIHFLLYCLKNAQRYGFQHLSFFPHKGVMLSWDSLRPWKITPKIHQTRKTTTVSITLVLAGWKRIWMGSSSSLQRKHLLTIDWIPAMHFLILNSWNHKKESWMTKWIQMINMMWKKLEIDGRRWFQNDGETCEKMMLK